MVFVWSHLTDGEPHFTLSQVALNDVIMIFAFAPIVALLLGLWAGCRPRTAAARGFLFGVGCFGPGIYWLYISVHTFGGAPVWLAVALIFAGVLLVNSRQRAALRPAT